MTFSFYERTAAEREILRVVNSSVRGCTQLAGLTEPAIERWASENNVSYGKGVADTIRNLARQCHRLAINSHQTFGTLETKIASDIAETLARLRRELEAD